MQEEAMGSSSEEDVLPQLRSSISRLLNDFPEFRDGDDGCLLQRKKGAPRGLAVVAILALLSLALVTCAERAYYHLYSGSIIIMGTTDDPERMATERNNFTGGILTGAGPGLAGTAAGGARSISLGAGARGLVPRDGAPAEQQQNQAAAESNATTPALAQQQEDPSQQSAAQRCSLEQQLHDKFHNVVLIINNHYEDSAKKSAEFLRAIYGRFFDHIVIICRKGIPELGIEARGPPPWRDSAWYSLYYLPKVTADYPNADGFLWTNDDVAINYWNLLKGNLSKLWLPNPADSAQHPFDVNATSKHSRCWAAQKSARKSAWEAFQAMDSQYRTQFERSTGPQLKGTYPHRPTDLLYIPRRFVSPLCYNLIPVFREYKVYSELAGPMMFFALEDPASWDHLLDDLVMVWGHGRVDRAPKMWNGNICGIHPWKLSDKRRKVKMLEKFSEFDPCIKRSMGDKYI